MTTFIRGDRAATSMIPTDNPTRGRPDAPGERKVYAAGGAVAQEAIAGAVQAHRREQSSTTLPGPRSQTSPPGLPGHGCAFLRTKG